MKEDYTKLYDTDVCLNRTSTKGKSGKWHNTRGLPYYGIYYRLRDAWNVLRLKADALYWTIDED